jgi:hypothetical protein
VLGLVEFPRCRQAICREVVEMRDINVCEICKLQVASCMSESRNGSRWLPSKWLKGCNEPEIPLLWSRCKSLLAMLAKSRTGA